MVVMSVEQYEEFRQERRIDAALRETDKEARENPVRYNFEEVSSKLRKKLVAKLEGTNS